MKKSLLFIPLKLFLLLVLLFAIQLIRQSKGDDPTNLESALIGKPLPVFKLPSLADEQHIYQQQDLYPEQVFLINVWATWCPNCLREHQFLNQLAQQGIAIVGLNYKDNRQDALKWLAKWGNPYGVSVFDSHGMLGLDLGVYGAPETFLIDKQGVIRYRAVGELNEQVWQSELYPVWQEYQNK